MNPWTAQALAHSRQNDLRHQAASYRRSSQPVAVPARPAPATFLRTPLRTRLTEHLGHTLIEAGLHLLATANPRP